mgnify:CR=1 FL=1
MDKQFKIQHELRATPYEKNHNLLLHLLLTDNQYNYTIY